MTLDEDSKLLWFSQTGDSSIKHLNLSKRNVERFYGTESDCYNHSLEDNLDIESPDFEMGGQPHITEYHIMRNKRYVITNNTEGVPQIWSIDKAKLEKSIHSMSYQDFINKANTKLDI